MLDKYFGFLKIQDQYSVIDSFLDHCKIDEEELQLVSEMIACLCSDQNAKLEDYYSKIRTINIESDRIFKYTGEQIINSNFDHQKQYDLLRLYQRIESISGLIISTAKRIAILNRLGGSLPDELDCDVKQLTIEVLAIHKKLKESLTKYLEDKNAVIELIEKIEELEHGIDHQRSSCLETLFRLGNKGEIGMGTFRAIENIIEHLEDVSDAIESAATSLEWLLIS